jgi:hypothetical protein
VRDDSRLLRAAIPDDERATVRDLDCRRRDTGRRARAVVVRGTRSVAAATDSVRETSARRLDRTVAYLEWTGRPPYFVLDGGEVDAFRQRFGVANRSGTLDWPPMATLGGAISVYDPSTQHPDASPLAIASTPGTHALCDAPQRWPPVLRMK